MLFNEKQMLDICKKYGIDVVKKDGYPLYMGEEMDENFSVEEMMKDSCAFHIDKNISSLKEHIKLTIPVFYEENIKFNYYNFEGDNMQLDFKYEKINNSISSSISFDNDNKFAA